MDVYRITYLNIRTGKRETYFNNTAFSLPEVKAEIIRLEQQQDCRAAIYYPRTREKFKYEKIKLSNINPNGKPKPKEAKAETLPLQPAKPQKETLQNLMNEIDEFATKTFGSDRNPATIYHLKKEADELIELFESPFAGSNLEHIRHEYADCFILLLNSASNFGFTADEVLNFIREKLEIVKLRKWSEPDENGICQHIKE